jgi:ubiquinol-cytochrome c reductase core subunit 2
MSELTFWLANDRAHFLSLLASVLSSTHYYAHEYAELVLPTIENEAIGALANPSTLALDIAHNIAFRRGLGNSLFAAAHSPITAADVKAYAQQAFSKSNIAVLGAGMTTEALSSAVNAAFGSGSSSGPTLSSPSSAYHGGEQRVPLDPHTGQPTLLMAFGTNAPPTAELHVLQHLLGGQSSIKWTTGTSPLSLIAEKIPGAKAEAFLLPYSDASLFGVLISAPTSEGVRTIAKEVATTVKGTSFKEEDVKKAIAKAKFTEASKSSTSLDTLLTTAGPAVSVYS